MIKKLIFDFVYHYLNDVIIYSESFEFHPEHIPLLLDRLKTASLTVKPEKIVFATQEIYFLGLLVSPGGVCIDPWSTPAICEFPAPRDTKSISRFIGIVNLYLGWPMWRRLSTLCIRKV